ncbi:MAG: hypothetical protein J1G38_07835, partial [Clostridiales bacterium]|nr:hypothetical protein [Clostridiales bacterium]
PTGYQSYGYLQPPTAPQPDPSTMLGAGSSQPQQQQLGLAAPPPQGAQTQYDGANMTGENDELNGL